jgi:hypothetical protein
MLDACLLGNMKARLQAISVLDKVKRGDNFALDRPEFVNKMS